MLPHAVAQDSAASPFKYVRPVAHNSFGGDAFRVQFIMIIIIITTTVP